MEPKARETVVMPMLVACPDWPRDHPATKTATRTAPRERSREAERPIGLRHLLLWTTGCAIYVGLIRTLAGEQITLRGNLLLVLNSLGQGAGIAALLALPGAGISRHRHRAALSPGVWLLFALGSETLAASLVQILSSATRLAGGTAAPAILVGCVLLWSTFDRRMAARWKLTFWLLLSVIVAPLTVAIVSGVAHFSSAGLVEVLSSPWFRPVAIMTILAGATVADWRCGRSLAGLHGVGIAAWLWGASIGLLFSYVL